MNKQFFIVILSFFSIFRIEAGLFGEDAYNFNQLFNLAALPDTLKTILKYRPDFLNKKNQDGLTPLMYAAKSGNRNRIKFLLEAKANPNIRSSDLVQHTDMTIDKGNNIALHYALFMGNTPNVVDNAKMLIDYGSDVNAANNSGDMPIHYLVQVQTVAPDRETIFASLLDHGADPNAAGYKGNTMVHHMVEKNDVQWLKVLAAKYLARVDFQKKNSAGQTPIELARFFNNTDMIRELAEVIALQKEKQKK